MDSYTMEQQHGTFHTLKSSFNEIFGRPEPVTPVIKSARVETGNKKTGAAAE